MFRDDQEKEEVIEPLTDNQERILAEQIPAKDSQEIIKVAEKLSSIISPYFIVIVGLYLFDDNFFLGAILILIGIFSLLNISWQDIYNWLEKVREFLKNE
ncbi:MAG: hypothetical protein NZ901_05160 [Geminocystis sp.]|nr:hypothetical protein [Geminocystis sp.]MCS7147563.1 hypothetical protein [Geminocystis sp.]MCX8077966.1 hypothetical protein [Geminocystis sp.]MDW8115256.1 hypothetical protein [Geminocystis sp.]MDW8464523.1 hypothetical protein [Geminocystis sp.]